MNEDRGIRSDLGPERYFYKFYGEMADPPTADPPWAGWQYRKTIFDKFLLKDTL